MFYITKETLKKALKTCHLEEKLRKKRFNLSIVIFVILSAVMLSVV